MEATATINVRMPESLKRGGGKVLERSKVSPSDLVRSVYSYMEQHQEIPPCLELSDDARLGQRNRRRALLREVAGTIELPEEFSAADMRAARAQRVETKYGDLL